MYMWNPVLESLVMRMCPEDHQDEWWSHGIGFGVRPAGPPQAIANGTTVINMVNPMFFSSLGQLQEGRYQWEALHKPYIHGRPSVALL